MTLQERYERLCATPTAINEHLPTLRKYAEQCESICEFGVDTGQSTTAFLMAQPEVVISIDLVEHAALQELFATADSVQRTLRDPVISKFGRTTWVLAIEDSRKTYIREVDLLFIDSAHSYEQMSVELARHHAQVRKFIICHDTFSFGTFGEAGPPQIGIVPAIGAFLVAHPEWQEREHFCHNNGLLILERVNGDS